MNITCGTDIIEIERIKDILEKEDTSFVSKVYTENEIEYCDNKKKMKYQHYAARFAAKEAIFKAVSDKLDDKFSVDWKDVQILNDANGRPEIFFLRNRPKDLESIEISISHCKEFAVANVVAVWKNGR